MFGGGGRGVSIGAVHACYSACESGSPVCALENVCVGGGSSHKCSAYLLFLLLVKISSMCIGMSVLRVGVPKGALHAYYSSCWSRSPICVLE